MSNPHMYTIINVHTCTCSWMCACSLIIPVTLMYIAYSITTTSPIVISFTSNSTRWGHEAGNVREFHIKTAPEDSALSSAHSIPMISSSSRTRAKSKSLMSALLNSCSLLASPIMRSQSTFDARMPVSSASHSLPSRVTYSLMLRESTRNSNSLMMDWLTSQQALACHTITLSFLFRRETKGRKLLKNST